MRAQEARLFKQQVEEDKKTTLDDLTRGVVNYKMLGLDFVRTERDGRLRYVRFNTMLLNIHTYSMRYRTSSNLVFLAFVDSVSQSWIKTIHLRNFRSF